MSTPDPETVRYLSSWDCYTSPHWIFVLTHVVACIIAITNSIVTIMGIYQLFIRKNKFSKLDSFIKKPSVKIYYTSINILYVIGPSIMIFSFSSILCTMPDATVNDGFHIFYYGMVTSIHSMAVGNIFLYLFFVLRIKILFDKISYLKMSNISYIILLSGFLAQLISEFLAIYYYCAVEYGSSNMHKMWDNALHATYAVFALNFFYSIILCIIFARKIYYLLKNNKDVQENQDIQMQIIMFAVRYLLLMMICLMSTNLLTIVNIIRQQLGVSIIAIMMKNILSLIDSFINILCLYLQFTFADNLYFKICSCWYSQHCFVVKLFGKDVINSMRIVTYGNAIEVNRVDAVNSKSPDQMQTVDTPVTNNL